VCLVWVSFLYANIIIVLTIVSYYACMCVLALDMRHAYRIYYAPHYIVFCVLPGWGIFFPNYLIRGSVFEKQRYFT
jgi:hypothetical protein